jgi:DNA-binding transcriptional MerR regulator
LFQAGAMTISGANAQQLPDIPNKLYFRIGDVSRLIGVRPSVLRYWESEFPALAPRKSGAGQRLYRRKEVELLLEIKHLLYDKRYTIEGARQYLEARAKNGRRERPAPAAAQPELFPAPSPALREIRDGLAAILDLLK